MADRKPFLLRLDRELHASLEHWAADEMRSLNAQIEYLLRRALREAGRDRRSAAALASPAAADAAPKDPPKDLSQHPTTIPTQLQDEKDEKP
ncbi:MAG: hypothetical protein ABIV06_06060 [Thermoanaerobaculia bacterium]